MKAQPATAALTSFKHNQYEVHFNAITFLFVIKLKQR